MPTMVSPGLYPREVDASFYVKQISTSTAAMIGVAQKGPINDPQLVTSWEQYVNSFGSYLEGDYYLPYAARAFFDNGGSSLWVNRVVHYEKEKRTSKKAVAKFNEQPSTEKTSISTKPAKLKKEEDQIVAEAISDGSWTNGIIILIEKASNEKEEFFDLKVFQDKDSQDPLEFFANIEKENPFVINGKSGIIHFKDKIIKIPTQKLTLQGGFDGLQGLNDNDFIGKQDKRTGLYSFDPITEINMLMIPGLTSPAIIKAGIAYAENRKDIIFIADSQLSQNPQEITKFRKDNAFNSSYAAIYYPWLVINDPKTGQLKPIPPSGAIAGCYAKNDQKANVWDAPAGIDRGKISNVLKLAYSTSTGERDLLYPNSINPIVVYPDTGINIWGQRTLQGTPSATDRVNVRRLMMYIEKAICESAKFVIFEPNHPKTWRALGRLIEPFLQDIKNKGGLYDFYFQCDEETNTPMVKDRNEMVARVFVKPTKTAEMVQLDFIIAGSGTNFKEI